MDEDNQDKLSKAIEALIPKCLDDIITQNREQAKCRLSTDEEIMALYSQIQPGVPKEIMEDWRFITLYLIQPKESQVMLLANRRSNGHPRITSIVRKIDLDRRLVITNSGTLYRLGEAGSGEPPFQHLMMVCAAFHSWGFGWVLGVPMIWF